MHTEVDGNTAALAERNKKLEAENALLKTQLQAALKINCALATLITNTE